MLFFISHMPRWFIKVGVIFILVGIIFALLEQISFSRMILYSAFYSNGTFSLILRAVLIILILNVWS